MQLVFSTDQLDELSLGSVVTIGNFDGLHLGHQALVSKVISLADQHKLKSVVLTFQPFPRVYFEPQKQHICLQRLSEKYLALRSMGIDYLLCLRFNKALAQLSPEDFVCSILVEGLKAKFVVVGDDFHFAKNRTGNVETLRDLGLKYGFSVLQLTTQQVDGERVSSTRVRAKLQAGDLLSVQQLLGRSFSLTARVVYGDQRGREWGFPTANLPLFRDQPPLTGIFAVNVTGEDFQANGVASIGFRPVFKLNRPLLEVYILDFDRDIYGQRLSVEFLYKIRDEADFDSVEDLVARIQVDVSEAKAFFASMN